MGGRAKRHTALAYAHERVEDDALAVFWIKAETRIDVPQSFTSMATLLDLKGLVLGGDLDQNRFLGMRWLRNTRKLSPSIAFDFEDGADKHPTNQKLIGSSFLTILRTSSYSEMDGQ